MTPTAQPRRLVVATYNVHGGVGSDGRYDPHRAASVLTEIGADIFGLQEVDSRPRRGNELDQFHLFEQSTGFHVVAGPNVLHGRHRYGNALLSRWPVRRTRLHDVSVGRYERRGVIDVIIDVAHTRLRVVTTHLGLRRRERRIQLERIATILDEEAHLPTVIMGDFNLWAWDAAAIVHLGHPPVRSTARTWPAWFPLLRHDRIWTRPAVMSEGLGAHRSSLARRASDHLPLVASVVLPAVACPSPPAGLRCRADQGEPA